jgi:hypothetical protein
MSRLAEIAPRLALAVEQERSHQMRGLHLCSCGYGWRIDGHVYDTGGCIESLSSAQRVRDHLERIDAEHAERRARRSVGGVS